MLDIKNKTIYADLLSKEIEVAITEDEINNKLIINSYEGNLLNEIEKSLKECISFDFSVAFINFSGLQLLLESFNDLNENKITGRIITSTYLNFTEPKALEKIKNFNNIDLKIFVTTKDLGFHTKVYIFEYAENYKIIIGSSNITQRALKSNIEWNVQVVSKEDNAFVQNVLKEYQKLWEITEVVDEDFLIKYEQYIKELKNGKSLNRRNFTYTKTILPNSMQIKAIENLNRLREHGEKKSLVIAATGTGKTFMSAFDVRNVDPEKMLFIVHREEILRKAKETFEILIDTNKRSTGLFTGTSKEKDANYLFSTIQTMSRHYEDFKENTFDYIIIDEAHHASSPSYEKIMDYFKPKFLLGMTATPERCDGASIFEIFDNNVALEVRLHDALEEELVIPFHYFGITDIRDVDLQFINMDNIQELTKRLNVNKRVDFIIEKMNFYGHDGLKRKSLGFCASKEHARFMAEEFNKKGIKSIALSSENSVNERENYIKKLENDEDELEVIFVIDIFNEGVDIPSINSVLMLRPTESPIIFIQQLGRGLRKHDNKEFLTVLDFIGNHNKAFLIAIALNGERYYDKDSLRVALCTGFPSLPGCTHIQMDRISQARILEQIENENFNSLKYLKEEYFEFKKMNGGKTPNFLMDYIKYEGAPDPIKFINKEKTYINFVAKVEKDEELKGYLENELFLNTLKELSNFLPIKRIHEFSIIKYLLKNEEISTSSAKNEILKYLEYIDMNSVKHALECLNGNYLDSGQKSRGIKLFNYENEKLKINDNFKLLLKNSIYKSYIEDIINYGIIRYRKEFGSTYYGVPFFKLYEQYQMIDVALLSNYKKIHSSFRGSGLLTNGNEYFLFIDLHKEADIKESINYEDKFLNRQEFQWQTPNSTSSSSERGNNIIFNKIRNINLHLFIRKYKEIDGKIQPYIYIGKGDTLAHHGEKPITITFKLQHEIPVKIFTEFINDVRPLKEKGL
ncbi:DEAD/DEAH box helicase [Clostridium grantii]|uniref:PLD-like domain-containing protein n=1 Tax=Clostridium grantii DSM 8605 TaxID=1121316 RepID=A0A1M5VGR5_9CLOT|nr:DEAD/DEAH box helicase [Clostridium grantii]SHH74391.1 PLD-like domain-containing protein [Clostridium grantii DSM 8605]